MLKLNRIFQEYMVLQSGIGTRIYGTGTPEKKIKVSIQGQRIEGNIEKDGSFEVLLKELRPSVQEELLVQCEDESIVLHEVSIGEVWVAAGQSNMEFWMRYEKHYREEKHDYANASIHFYDVPKVCYDGQEESFDYHNVGKWRTASNEDIEYFSAVGYYFAKNMQKYLGIPIGIIGCNWGGTSSSVWMSMQTLEKVGMPWNLDYKNKFAGRNMEEYWKAEQYNPENDQGNSTWSLFNEMMLPQTPSMDEIGQMIQSAMGGNASDWEEDSAKYKEMLLRIPPQSIPASLYGHMVKKLAPFAIKGVLWYQGESDDVAGFQCLYKDMLSGLIQDWRTLWDNQALPFCVVQLPGFERWLHVENLNYSVIREAQEWVCKHVDNVYLCSIGDAGEQFDIHPKDKLVVGKRLADVAAKHVYQKDILADPPMPIEAVKNHEKIEITFENAGKGLIVEGNCIEGLELLSETEKLNYSFCIDGAKLILHMIDADVQTVKISFAQGKWYRLNLYNSNMVPAIPFILKVEKNSRVNEQ